MKDLLKDSWTYARFTKWNEINVNVLRELQVVGLQLIFNESYTIRAQRFIEDANVNLFFVCFGRGFPMKYVTQKKNKRNEKSRAERREEKQKINYEWHVTTTTMKRALQQQQQQQDGQTKT